MTDVVIVAATRTAVGSFGGSLASLSAVDLGAGVIRSLLDKAGINRADVDEVLMGQVLTAAGGQNPARQSVIKAGLPVTVPAMTINKVCGSGLKALHLAAQAIKRDRKSTRLNSSHVKISYAVFCSKKKKNKKRQN